MKTLDINKFLESSLFKIMINKNGEVLGMTKAFKALLNMDSTPNYISEIFDKGLLEQIEEYLADSFLKQAITQNCLTGYLIQENKRLASCYIIYQPHSEKAIITIKIDEQRGNLSHLYENAFKQANVPMALVNEWGFFVSMNEEFNRIFPRQFLGTFLHLKKFLESFHCDKAFCYSEYLHKAKTEGYVQYKMVYRENGYDMHLNVLLQRDRETEMYVLKILDISEQEHLLQLLAHSDQLSTTGEIAASIAHEVRNPMTTLQGFLQLLEHEVTGNAYKYVTVIQGEVKRMNEILNEMLSLSKPSVDEITVFSLSVLVEDVLVLLRPKALLDQINLFSEILVKEPVLIKGNPNRMKQVLVNLLKNAMEAMEPKGILNVQVLEGEEESVDIFISDTGIGMSEEIMETIFLPFVSGKPGGTGLGLPFVKKTVNEFGGSISVSSELGKGSVFHLIFPRTAVAISTLNS
ncbi:two-component system sensor histidine kinase NtrB [Sporosarcina obsidiansis]|uniref:two-component system sensor histidine kinase NtrB n=1 Tax=Sporosarcina obsidiansis TaxID=2660748 RepID=UPI0018914E37|nr:HAMP domain-containing sensor histidine kinase [Sporosarcina obsidiansis]